MENICFPTKYAQLNNNPNIKKNKLRGSAR